MDVMPTLLDIVGAEIPDGVDGKSLVPLVMGEDETRRRFVHGECASRRLLVTIRSRCTGA